MSKRHQYYKNLDALIYRKHDVPWVAILIFLSICLIFILGPCSMARAEVFDAELICQKIYIIEGGADAVSPYGILSVKCDSKTKCEQICVNTVQNSFTLYQLAGSKGDFLQSLASRYCPIGAENDNGSNKFWLSNLRYYLGKNQ